MQGEERRPAGQRRDRGLRLPGLLHCACNRAARSRPGHAAELPAFPPDGAGRALQGILPGAMKSYRGPPMTLGSAAAAHVRLMVWCKACGHRSEPDPAEQARWFGPETTMPDWRRRLVCSKCGSRNVDFVVSGASAHFSKGVGASGPRI